MGKVYKYELYFKGEKVREGSLSELSAFLNFDQSNLKRGMVEDGDISYRMIGEYKLVKTNETIRYTLRDSITNEIPKKVDYSSYGEVLIRLKRYGNTICTKDPTPYLPDFLEKEGLDCRVYERCDKGENANKLFRHKGTGDYFYIEVVG